MRANSVGFSSPLELVATKRGARLDGIDHLTFPPAFLSRVLRTHPPPGGGDLRDVAYITVGTPVPTIRIQKSGRYGGGKPPALQCVFTNRGVLEEMNPFPAADISYLISSIFYLIGTLPTHRKQFINGVDKIRIFGI